MTNLVGKHTIARANTALILCIVWGGLAACALGAIVYDFGRLFDAW